MVMPEFLSAEMVAAGVFVVALAAEVVHTRRCRHLSPLAFGNAAQRRRWTAVAAPLRILAVASDAV